MEPTVTPHPGFSREIRETLRNRLPRQIKNPIAREQLRTTFFEKVESIFDEETASRLAKHVCRSMTPKENKEVIAYISDVQAIRKVNLGATDILTVASSHRLNTAVKPELQLSINNNTMRGHTCVVSLVTPFGRTQLASEFKVTKDEQPLAEEGDTRIVKHLKKLRADCSKVIDGRSIERKLPTLTTIQWSAMLYLFNQREL